MEGTIDRPPVEENPEKWREYVAHLTEAINSESSIDIPVEAVDQMDEEGLVHAVIQAEMTADTVGLDVDKILVEVFEE